MSITFTFISVRCQFNSHSGTIHNQLVFYAFMLRFGFAQADLPAELTIINTGEVDHGEIDGALADTRMGGGGFLGALRLHHTPD